MGGIGTSEPPKLAEYDVFLSFRGFDTRKNFTSCLYHDLVGAGIRVFRDDDELSKGKEIGEQLLRAMANSRICMPILSPNFATSAWCLREVAHMVECRRNSGHKLEILPIFYKADVADVKLRAGSTYEVHINRHRDRFEEEVLLKWKDALKEVAKIKGWSLNDDTDHGELIKSIVKDVMVKLNLKYRNVPTYLVGLQGQVDELMKLIDVDSEDVKFIVIHGIGGIGKTTLAKVVFNKIHFKYEGCSFLDNVGAIAKRHGHLDLQKKLLYDFLNNDFAMDIRDINDGINMIRGRLSHKKILIVIDGVDEDSQLKNLAGRSGWFGSGSRIIITTRDRGVLVMDEKFHKPLYHEVKQMPFDDALCLFSWHAFGQDYPTHEYDNISRDIVSATANLPLALEVIGSLLSCKCLDSCTCMEIWKDTLNELRRVPNKKVEETLMISINKLNVKERKVFLDIACFLIHEDKDNAIYMWRACDISIQLVMNLLIQMSLINIGDDNRFRMHDQLRDLGREIVRRENDNLGRRSRVWVDQEAEEIINNDQGTELVEVLCLSSGNFTITCNALAKLRNLRFLKLKGGQFKSDLKRPFEGHLENLLPNLRWFHWQQIPSNFEMNNFCPSNLVVLELCDSSITEHWEGWRQLKVANKLKVLDLSGCSWLQSTPDFSSFFLLERLLLKGCSNLVDIDTSIGKLKKLTYLDLEGCSLLRRLPEEIGLLTSLTTFIMRGDGHITKLPESIGELKSLRYLSLRSCERLEKLPDSIGNLESLVELDISGTGIIELPDSVENLKSLKRINMSRSGIRRISSAIGLLKSLEELRASECSKLRGEVPMEIGGLSTLKILHLWDSEICGIPKSLYNLSHLKELSLTVSNQDKTTDFRWIRKLSQLEAFAIKSSHFTALKLPLTLKTLLINGLTFMSGASLNDEHSLVVAIPCLEELQMLHDFYLKSCNFCNLDGLHHLRNLKTLSIEDYHKRFPDLSNLRNLIFVRLVNCDGLVEIHGLGKLQLLQALLIEDCNSLEALNCLSNLINLKWLNISKCARLRGVEGLVKLQSLLFLVIQDCSSLYMLPDMPLIDREEPFFNALVGSHLASLLGSQLMALLIECPVLDTAWMAEMGDCDMEEIMMGLFNDYIPFMSSCLGED